MSQPAPHGTAAFTDAPFVFGAYAASLTATAAPVTGEPGEPGDDTSSQPSTAAELNSVAGRPDDVGALLALLERARSAA